MTKQPLCCYSYLFCVLLDVSDSVTYSSDLLCLVVGNRNTKLLLELHNQLNGIQRICTQIICEAGLSLYFCLINTEFINDNCLYFAFIIENLTFTCTNRGKLCTF